MPVRSEIPSRENTLFPSKITDIRDQLRKQAYLYESPQDFRAGVEAAYNAIQRESQDDLFTILDEIDVRPS